jgi:hypothetical protein
MAEEFTVAILDEAEVDNDPTLLVFRGDEEEAAVTIHLNPNAECDLHQVLEPEICGEDYMAGQICMLYRGHDGSHR